MTLDITNGVIGIVGSRNAVAALRRRLDALAVETVALTDTVSGRLAAIVVLADDTMMEPNTVRATWGPMPVVVVCDDTDRRIAALRAYADDAVAGDVGAEELVARIAAVSRRAAEGAARKGVAPASAPFRLDEDRRVLWLADREIRLTPRQARVMSVLRGHPAENPISLGRIHQAVCSDELRNPAPETIRVHISMLNKKLASVRGTDVRIRCGSDGYYLQPAA